MIDVIFPVYSCNVAQTTHKVNLNIRFLRAFGYTYVRVRVWHDDVCII